MITARREFAEALATTTSAIAVIRQLPSTRAILWGRQLADAAVSKGEAISPRLFPGEEPDEARTLAIATSLLTIATEHFLPGGKTAAEAVGIAVEIVIASYAYAGEKTCIRRESA